ncbi:histidine phosphatase family protein [Litorivita sp. NS0012-18]|uniref:histidine phosphatase family protein n=1 Tax=Litorivita sp. NS0012-18 TaxID=3127655 RepID=UPI0033411040
MSRFFWVRHGPTHANSMVGWSDIPADLSDAALIARVDAHLPQDALVISSDLIRAVDTATAIGGARRRLPHDRDLREIHFGAWELQRFNEVDDPAHIKRFWEEPGDVKAPDGESWNDLHVRVSAAAQRLIAAHPGRDIIAVAHFGAILSQVQTARGQTASEAFAQKIDNLSVTELHWTGDPAGPWRPHRVNHIP